MNNSNTPIMVAISSDLSFTLCIGKAKAKGIPALEFPSIQKFQEWEISPEGKLQRKNISLIMVNVATSTNVDNEMLLYKRINEDPEVHATIIILDPRKYLTVWEKHYDSFGEGIILCRRDTFIEEFKQVLLTLNLPT